MKLRGAVLLFVVLAGGASASCATSVLTDSGGDSAVVPPGDGGGGDATMPPGSDSGQTGDRGPASDSGGMHMDSTAPFDSGTTFDTGFVFDASGLDISIPPDVSIPDVNVPDGSAVCDYFGGGGGNFVKYVGECALFSSIASQCSAGCPSGTCCAALCLDSNNNPLCLPQ